MNITLVT